MNNLTLLTLATWEVETKGEETLTLEILQIRLIRKIRNYIRVIRAIVAKKKTWIRTRACASGEGDKAASSFASAPCKELGLSGF